MIKFNTTPILGHPIAHFEKKLVEDKSRFDDVEFGDPRRDGGVVISCDHCILDNKKFEDIKNIFMDVVEQYKTDILGIKNGIQMTNSWVTKNTPGHKHHIHNHPNCFISMTHYLECESGSLKFEFDKSAIERDWLLAYDIIEYNLFNSQSWTFEVKTDDTVIFPGAVKHHSTTNNSNKNRLMLGANFFFKGQYGTYEDITKVIF